MHSLQHTGSEHRGSEHRGSPQSGAVPQDPHAVILTTTVAQQPVVARLCRTAALAGVRQQMPLPVAQALCPEAYVERFNPVRDRAALQRLAVWCLRFSPLVGLDHELTTARTPQQIASIRREHYGITIDLSGTRRLHGSPLRIGTTLHTALKGRARIAIAPTIGAAWALSRYGTTPHPVFIPRIEDIPAALAHLPLPALRIDRANTQLLHDLGITELRALLHLPRHTLTQRFGKHLMYRLRQALGELEERLLAVTPEAEHRCAHTFEPPLTTQRAIVTAINQLFSKLLNSLQHQQLVAQHFQLTVQDTTTHTFSKEFHLASASADRAHLTSIITPLIESFRFSGEIRVIALSASNVRPFTTEQESFAPVDGQNSASKRAQDELINALTLRIGHDRVLRASLHQSYIPERSFSYTPLTSIEPHAQTLMEPLVPYNVQERPSIILTDPEPISTIAALPDKPPAQICWRDTRLTVLSGVGPERLAPEWWNQQEKNGNDFATRDYFKVQDQYGRWLWVFREDATMRWFLHGIWL